MLTYNYPCYPGDIYVLCKPKVMLRDVSALKSDTYVVTKAYDANKLVSFLGSMSINDVSIGFLVQLWLVRVLAEAILPG